MQLRVEAIRGEQFAMRADFHETSTIQHGDAIGVFYRRQAMRDDDRGAPRQHSRQRLLDQGLALGILGRGGLIENQHRGVFEERARQRQALALTAGEIVTLLEQYRTQPSGQGVHEPQGVRGGEGGADFGVAGLAEIAVGDVLAHAGGEERGVSG